jgi:hypothetical protein
VSRSRDEIAEDIRQRLRKRRYPRSLTVSYVLAELKRLDGIWSKLVNLPTVAAVRAQGQQAKDILKKTRELYGEPPDVPSGYDSPDILRLSFLAGATGSKADFDRVGWHCAHAACLLVERAGGKPSDTLKNGATYDVAKLIREAMTGETVDEDSKEGLKALQKVIEWRRDGSPGLAPQIRIGKLL